MSKIVLSNLTSLANDASVITTINNNMAIIQAAVDGLYSRDGTSPNSLSADIDFNGKTGINLKAPVLPGDIVRLIDSPAGNITLAQGYASAASASATSASASATAAATSVAGALTAGAISISYNFSTTTADTDPGNGTLRLSNATQNLSTTIRLDLLDTASIDWTTVLNTLADSTNTVKGHVRLVKKSDSTKFLIFTSAALASPSGYKNLTVTNVGGSSASPFVNGDQIVFVFTRAGDVGASGGGSGDMIAANNLSDVVNKATGRTNLGVAIGSNVQAWDSDLDAFAAISTNGVVVRTGAGTATTRTLTADTGAKAGISISNGDGVAGALTIGVDILNQTTDGSPDGSADYVMTYDASAAINKKVLLNNLSSSSSIDYQAFTSSGTWTKPAGLTGNELVRVILWGAGAGGTQGAGRSGGAGGSCVEGFFKLSDLGATESVVIAGTTAVTTTGGNSTFKGLTAYGGSNAGSSGGGGGGFYATGAGTGIGGGPSGGTVGGASAAGADSGSGLGGGGGGGGSNGGAGGQSVWGGGGGGGGATNLSTGIGGNSVYGGGGGGGGASTGGPNAGGTSVFGGNGGTGGNTANGNIATAGSAPGGGGGGATTTAGTGGRGECRVWVIKS